MLKSSFRHADVDVAFVEYCNGVWSKSPTFTKPTKAQFRKMHAKRHALYLKQHGTTTYEAPANSSAKPVPVSDEVIEVGGKSYTMNAAGALVPVAIVETPEYITVGGKDYVEAEDGSLVPVTAPTQYRTKLSNDAIPSDAARNAKLWRLNVEGFITINADGGCDPITDTAASEFLNTTFGPLS